MKYRVILSGKNLLISCKVLGRKVPWNKGVVG